LDDMVCIMNLIVQDSNNDVSSRLTSANVRMV